jgi:hypothetical protein
VHAVSDMPVVFSKGCAIAKQQQCCKALHHQQQSCCGSCHCEPNLTDPGLRTQTVGRRGREGNCRFCNMSRRRLSGETSCTGRVQVVQQHDVSTNVCMCMGLPMPSRCVDPGLLPAVTQCPSACQCGCWPSVCRMQEDLCQGASQGPQQILAAGSWVILHRGAAGARLIVPLLVAQEWKPSRCMQYPTAIADF